jgi:membrane-associated protein
MTTLEPPQADPARDCVPSQPVAGGTGAGSQAGQPADGRRWRPWHGRPRVRDLVCAAFIVISGLYALATIPLTPEWISTRPVLLELVAGSNSAVVAAGAFSDVDNKLQLVVVVFAALPGMMRFDWVFWWAGRLWGHRIVERLGRHSPRVAGMAAVAEQRGRRLAAVLVAVSSMLPVSPAPVYAAAGWVGLPLTTFLIFDAIGTAAWASLLAAFGYLLGRNGITVANLVSKYALVTICVLLATALIPHAWHAWRGRSRAGRKAGPLPGPAVPGEPGSAGPLAG